jgi:hypothetical protein
MDDFNNAIERIVAGLEKRSRLLHPHERKVVAYHEMGHALVAATLPTTDPVHKVSIIPRGIGALGYTIQRPEEERFLMTTRELNEKMAVLMGGRAAEQVVFGEISTGAADDLDKISDIARHMVTRYGMDAATHQVVYDPQRQSFLGITACRWRGRAATARRRRARSTSPSAGWSRRVRAGGRDRHRPPCRSRCRGRDAAGARDDHRRGLPVAQAAEARRLSATRRQFEVDR